MKKQDRLFFSITGAVVILDQLTKIGFSKSIALHHSLPIIPGFLDITLTHNTGAAFSILQNMATLLGWVSLFVAGLILFFYDKYPKNYVPFVGLILGGTIGNLIDRMAYGYVIDFINFSFWPTFNVADSALCIGVAGVAYFLIKEK